MIIAAIIVSVCFDKTPPTINKIDITSINTDR